VNEQRRILSWALYDWANSAFATVVMAGFFPLFFRDFWNAGQASTDITFRLGLANSVSSIGIMLLGPILGAIADRGGAKKRLLFFFAFLGMVMTAGLYWVHEGQWPLAVLLYIASTLGFMGANVFYDSLLVAVTRPERYDRVSAYGFGLGYLGGGLLFAFCVLLTLKPEVFGLAGLSAAVQVSFLLVAGWWALFSLPLLLWVPEPRVVDQARGLTAIRDGLRQLAQTAREIRALRHVALFLAAYWLYIDGVDTVVRMAVDYGRALGFGASDLITALLVVQFIGFPAAIAFGRLAERIGTKKGIFLGIGVYCLVTFWATRMDQTWEFYGLAVAIGLVQGGVQALSRSYYARLIPKDKSAEFFGFYNMMGKFAAVLGPIMVGWIGAVTGNPRLGLLSLLVLFLGGAVLLVFVRPERAGTGTADQRV
jgi:UMF1 family MFS transporter